MLPGGTGLTTIGCVLHVAFRLNGLARMFSQSQIPASGGPRVGFVALRSPNAPKSWSGTPYYSLQALRKRMPDISVLDTPILDGAVYTANKFTSRVGLDLLREPVVQAIYRTALKRALAGVDIVVAVGGQHKLAGLSEDQALILASDGLFRSIVRSYPKYSQLSRRSKRLGEQLQQRMLRKIDLLCLASDWATAAAERDYDLQGVETVALAFGSNFENDPGFDVDTRQSANPFKLLFIGADWERKGGPLVLETFAWLKAHAPDAELHIVGCRPQIETSLPDVFVHGFLRKHIASEHSKLVELFRTSGFLFVPSRQEAFGMIFAEANSYGLPSVSCDVGGIGQSLTHGHNAILLGPTATAQAFADEMHKVGANATAHMAMAQNARRVYEAHPGWDAWADAMVSHIARIYGRAVPRDAVLATV